MPPFKVGAWSDAFISKVLVATFEVMEERGEAVMRPFLQAISPVSPPYLPHISLISRLYLPYISLSHAPLPPGRPPGRTLTLTLP